MTIQQAGGKKGEKIRKKAVWPQNVRKTPPFHHKGWSNVGAIQTQKMSPLCFADFNSCMASGLQTLRGVVGGKVLRKLVGFRCARPNPTDFEIGA